MKLLLSISIIGLILLGCTMAFRPHTGMAEKNFIQKYRMVYWNDPIISYADEDIKVYTHGQQQFYYFKKGKLISIVTMNKSKGRQAND